MNLNPWIHPDTRWLDHPDWRKTLTTAAIAASGLALYGFSMGYWRDPLMGIYVAIKLPWVIGLTLICNGMLNGMLAMLLGSSLGCRQSLLALLSSFALAGILLGSLSPITLMLAWCAPAIDSAQARSTHSALLVMHTTLIAFAGIAANIHLYQLLLSKSPNRRTATTTLLAWLGGNGFLGAQFSWVLRPFFGTPGIDLQFLRPDPLRGNFYQSFWKTLANITHGHPLPILLVIIAAFAAMIFKTTQTIKPQ